MKKTIILLTIALAIIATTFTGCKKGENDPFLSLKSRTGRLSQDWKLTSEDITTTTPSHYLGTDYLTTDKYSINGSQETDVSTTTSGSYSQTTTNTYSYTMEITFDKDGTYEMVEINDGTTTTTDGNWMWMSKNKDQDMKNKEAIVMTITKQTDSNGNTDTYSGKSNMAFQGMAVFDKLSKDEIVMNLDFSNTDSSGDTYTYTGTKTFSVK